MILNLDLIGLSMKYIFTFLILSTLAVAGCGIKPTKLEPPASSSNEKFPDTYPKSAVITNQQN
jgi:hypothetical protein